MTNPLKGEVNLTIGKETYKARLTVDSIVRIEESIGCGILKLAQRMADADIRISDVVSILTIALRGGGNDIQAKDVHKIIADAGIVESVSAVANLLTEAISPSDDSMEDSEGGAKKKET